jgi:hypothetical protein
VSLRRGAAKRTSIWCTEPHSRHSTRGMGSTRNVGREPMDSVRKRRSTCPRDTSSPAPQAGHRQSWGSWRMVKITGPSE